MRRKGLDCQICLKPAWNFPQKTLRQNQEAWNHNKLRSNLVMEPPKPPMPRNVSGNVGETSGNVGGNGGGTSGNVGET